MKRTITIIVYLVLVIGIMGAFIQQAGFQKVQMKMQTRTAASGYTTNMNATLFFSTEGKMVTLMEEPYKTIAINNLSGELTLYNFEQNSVFKESNPAYSLQSNNLYYFLQNKKQDLGLTESGFKLIKTSFEDGLKVTRWASPMQISKQIKEVELVHNKANPVFIAYIAPNGQYIKKTYFYQFSDLMGVEFPSAITEITYIKEKDSVITKTSYSDFQFNETVQSEYLDFKIPSNAKIVSPK